MIRIALLTLLALSALTLAGCNTVVPPLQTEFPSPLIEPLPLSVGVYYDEDLRNFVYNETVSDGSHWQIELGQNNTRLFDRLFGSLFSRVVSIPDIDNAPAGIDAVVQPVLEEYAFLTPRELGSRFYAVSIRYRIFLFDPDGNELAAWPVNAYGQSRDGAKSPDGVKASPLQEATNLAMRDAAAGIIIMLPGQPEIRALIDSTATESASYERRDADTEVDNQERSENDADEST
jgi:hypothetical protein